MSKKGEELKKMRLKKYISVAALSRISKVSQRTIRRIEKGENIPRDYTYVKIIDALNSI